MVFPAQSRHTRLVNRRQFLQRSAVSVGCVAWPMSATAKVQRPRANCIVLFLTGGPSHLETFDPKPDAPEHIRGPFGTIPTRIPGVRFSEYLPGLAARSDRFTLIRSVFHRAPAIHETGQQLLQTGRLSRPGCEYPSVAAMLALAESGTEGDRPRTALLPGPLGNTGVSVSHGQGAGFLGSGYEPWVPDPATCRRLLQREPARLRERYGQHRFGQMCLLARCLIEKGLRMVTVNMFDTVFNETTWDCHADGCSLATDFDDYRNILCPTLDQASTALLDDLEARGLLQETLVVIMGEFGRTPIINPRGGRDHWPHVWSVLLAGGPAPRGLVIGASDRHGCEPASQPVPAASVAATIYHAVGLEPMMQLRDPHGDLIPAMEADPITPVIAPRLRTRASL